MYRSLAVLILSLSACTQPVSQSTNNMRDLTVPENSCQGSSQSICAFFNAPLRLVTTPIRLFLRTENFYPMARDLQFIDSDRKKWVAPKGTLTDGASIPPVFVSMIGAPQSKEFVNAAAIHDAYCGIGNDNLPQFQSDTWQNVHRMFYDALRVGGTSATKAKIMFAAVYIGGPRWTPPPQPRGVAQVTRASALPGLQISTKSVEEPLRSVNGKTLRQIGLSNQILRRELEVAIDFIKTNNPTIAELERFLIGREFIWRDRSGRYQIADQGTPPPPLTTPTQPGAPTPVVPAPVVPAPVTPAPVVTAPVVPGTPPTEVPTPTVPTAAAKAITPPITQ